MTTVITSILGVGELISKTERIPAIYELHYPAINLKPVADLNEDSPRNALPGSITGRLQLKIGISQTTLAEKGLLFEMHDRKLAFRFSFLNKHGEIAFEDWVD